MKRYSQAGRYGAVVVFALAAAEVLVMISPFAGFFYASLRFEPLLGWLSQNSWTAWLDGFFLNHAVVTDSVLLEWHRKAGPVLLAAGLVAFLVSAVQVYTNKLLKRGVAKGLLYRYVRHPQYLSLVIAGWGLLAMWPRFLLLGIWVTMVFLYAGLARHEERRMEEKFGEDYRRFAASRGRFLPRSPLRGLIEATSSRLPSPWVAWPAAYALSLAFAFSAGFILLRYTRAHSAVVFHPERQLVVVSTWPQPHDWIERVLHVALADERVERRSREARGDSPVVATILAPRYGMKRMYYPAAHEDDHGPCRGVDPSHTTAPVEIVFSRVQKAYKKELALEEVLDPGVRLTPLVVAEVAPATAKVTDVRIPPPRNGFGPNVVMPVF